MKTIKERGLVLVCALLMAITCTAHEGMWIPALLEALNEDHMQANGLKLSAEDIYSINESSLKDAIVHFGGGCTAEVISEEGLILTNYHCGYSQVQSHSSVENDYLKLGYWAMTRGQELKNPGLTATFIERIEDVTDRVLTGVTDEMSAIDREKVILDNSGRIENESTKGTGLAAKIRPFFYGNHYYMIVTRTYMDVRLVGAPPSSIGKFGGDTDNWVWPRHTGDFALFRIYADASNQPAEYADTNKPYNPKKSLQISMDGVKEGDFNMVYGFPGRTQQYLHSDAVDYEMNVANPAKIKMRETSLEIIDKAMAEDDEVRIQYAAKQARISNAYKKWIGQNFGLTRNKAVEVKRAREKEFNELLKDNDDMRSMFNTVVKDLSGAYSDLEKYATARHLFIEYVYYGPEVLRFANSFDNLLANYEALSASGELADEISKLKSRTESHFKNYDRSTDKNIMDALTPLYMSMVDKGLQPDFFQKTLNSKYKGKVSVLSGKIYGASFFVDKERTLKALNGLNKGVVKKMKADPPFQLSSDFLRSYRSNVGPKITMHMKKIDELMRGYVKAQQIVYPEKTFSADANGTLRLTYGKVEGSKPKDGVIYRYYTTFDGVIDKYQPGHRDFDLPERLVELHKKGDYGRYADDETGELHVCYTGSNHTSGGNSGSPSLDAEGRLVGLNFDRTWESTMSDIMFDPEICRNIMVDIRYVLFIIDEFAGAGHIIDELDLVKSK